MSDETTDKSLAKPTMKSYLASPGVQNRIKELLGKRSSQFTTSVVSMINTDAKLAACEPTSLFMACLTAAALDLPISKSLGHAHILPYENRRAGITEAQFILGYKGLLQLAQRSGSYETINATDVRLGEPEKRDRLTGTMLFHWCEDDDERAKLPIVGYVAYFKLTSGFEKQLYMSMKELEEHAKRYSKAYAYDLREKIAVSPWSTDFNSMAIKTVLKLLISKYGPMSIEMQKATHADYGIVREDEQISYVEGEMPDVGADDDKKQAIIAANSPLEGTVEHIGRTRIEPETKAAEDHMADVGKVFNGAEDITPKQAKKESVREKAERLYGKAKPADDNHQ